MLLRLLAPLALLVGTTTTASGACTHCVKPAWTWDHLSSFIHNSNLTGLFNDEELDVLEKADMVGTYLTFPHTSILSSL